MHRFLPDAPVWEPPVPQGQTTLTLTLKTITPLFGGSARPQKVDEQTPIRTTAIRGHLRFWWRATTSVPFATLGELAEAEARRFGEATNHDAEDDEEDNHADQVPSPLKIRVTVLQSGQRQPCGEFKQRPNRQTGIMEYPVLPKFADNWPPYALQPFQGKITKDKKEIEVCPSVALLNVVFRLELTVANEFKDELLQALAAWITFGGIGARTRRGCGSIALVEGSVASLLPRQRRRDSDLLTLIPGTYQQGNSGNDPLVAWNTAVTLYRDFRQQVGFARDKSTDGPGRSHWPEADSLRRLADHHSDGHAPPARTQAHAFPRADLGLPIIFHFKDRGDPEDATLAGQDRKRARFASPVITKALALPNNQFVPLIAILDAPHVWALGDLELTSDSFSAPVAISPAMVQDTVCPPMSRCGKREIREALLSYVKSQNQGFKETRL